MNVMNDQRAGVGWGWEVWWVGVGGLPDNVFQAAYGITKRLEFKKAGQREAQPSDMWSLLY